MYTMSRIVKVKNLNIGQGRPKICGLVIGTTAEDFLDLAEKSNTVDCDMIEIRIDHFENVTDINQVKSLLRKIKRTAKKPGILTFRNKSEGGHTEITLEYYRELLLMAAENSLADIIDVEAATLEGDGSFVERLKDCGVYVIISKHDFNKTPKEEEIIRTYIDMEKLGGDIVKVAYMPNSRRDVLNLISATEVATSNLTSCPIVAISMGHLGMITRIMGEFMESAITFAAITKTSAPGQINIDSMGDVLDIIHNNYKKVFLVGFTGSGKTAVANTLSLNYGLKKVDLDAYIEKKEHDSISDLISGSESLFREKETKYLRSVIKQNYQVISLSTGAVLRSENIGMMKEKGVIIFLRAKPETIEERIKNDRTRPFLADNFDLDYISNLMKEREELFTKAADVIIDTDGKSVEEISREIVKTLGFAM